jgi:EAL domain-containing protein (putative c-di-GMP-specific phosphodiesterase class I)
VIAEGVETDEQKQALLNKSCNHMQGFLFGKPMPIELFEASLQPG